MEITMKNKKDKMYKWRIDLGYSVFEGNKKIKDVTLKKNITKKDLEILGLMIN